MHEWVKVCVKEVAHPKLGWIPRKMTEGVWGSVNGTVFITRFSLNGVTSTHTLQSTHMGAS